MIVLIIALIILGIAAPMTVTEYFQEIKFDTCHVVFDIYNLTNYYNCIGM